MKLVLLLLLSVTCFAQKTFVENGKLNGILPLDDAGLVSYVSIKSIEGVSKQELFKRSRNWFASHFNSDKNTTEVNDSNTGDLMGKGVFYVKAPVGINKAKFAVYHTLKVELKEGKCRITLTNFELNNTSDLYGRTKPDAVMMAGKKTYEVLYPAIQTEASALIASLEKALTTADDF